MRSYSSFKSIKLWSTSFHGRIDCSHFHLATDLLLLELSFQSSGTQKMWNARMKNLKAHWPIGATYHFCFLGVFKCRTIFPK